MKRTAVTLTAVGLLGLAGCGSGEDEESVAEASSAPATTSTAAATSSTPRSTASSTPTPASTSALSPEAEQALVRTIFGQVFTNNQEALSNELVKSNSLVEAQTEFRFDPEALSLVLGVTSTYSTDTYVPELAYDLAAGFAPVFWGPEGTDSVRPESLPSFSTTVDALTYVCDGPTMVALQDRELSQEMFVERCSV
ncbi:hypothetical protein [Modestobacter sp. VKM Ac-2985]|uniref:hypothetical protein n=1 Tax=Modestobacter sp. VKM Ac-2985 TaxID=3004139 RepID=UPI0022AB8157|nr:hypothetical protein [Modestobacter sp. VKM Ac-2985]MCZ2837123.1 hypothetical protein [Modestobacter sp. VKM Ac-2985]